MEFHTVCRYFLEGRCRFGQNCRNEHVYSNNGGGNNDLNNVLWKIANEVTVAEKGGQWPLTSFAPIAHRTGLPGWVDISPEEVRWTLYEASKNGTVNQALSEINQWYKNAEKARSIVKQRTPEIANVISKLVNENQSGLTSSSTFSSSVQDSKSLFRFDTAVTNIFDKPSVPTQSRGNIFGNSPGLSGPSDTSNIFSRPQQQQQAPSQNIFSNGISSSQNFFSSSPGGSGSIFSHSFSSSNATNENIFQTVPSTNIFRSSVPAFGSNSNAFSGVNAFQQSNHGVDFNTSSFKTESTGFGVSNESAKEVDSSIYSKIEDLTENEVNAFTSMTFTFGMIPLKPPPLQYC